MKFKGKLNAAKKGKKENKHEIKDEVFNLSHHYESKYEVKPIEANGVCILYFSILF